jgi:hypothetical protein
MNEKRKQIETLVDGVMMKLDPTGSNSKKYRNMFQTMSDKQFADWANAFFKDEKSQFRLDIQEFGNVPLRFENIDAAAKFMNLKLFEYVYIPHVSSDPNRPVRTKQPVLVGYLNIKRPQQLVTKKTGLSLTDTNRDELSGTAKGDSKGGTTSGIENELLAGVGADEIISEISGARGDNVNEYDNMIASISETGSCKLADIKTTAYDKPTLLKSDIFLRAMGFKTDLVSESYYSIDRVRAALNGTKNT